MYNVWIMLFGAGVSICVALIMVAEAVLDKLAAAVALLIIGWTVWKVTRPPPASRNATFQDMAEAKARDSVKRHEAEINALRIVQEMERSKETPRRSSRLVKE